MKVLPLKEAYPFGANHGLADEIAAIKEMEIKDWKPSYWSTVRRGFVVELFSNARIFNAFKQQCWPDGDTDWGTKKTVFYLGVKRRYEDFTAGGTTNRVRPTSYISLAEDLRKLKRQRINQTTKEALVNARVGQGSFRTQVLQRWNGRCAVTRSAILEAVRASHIKPWRRSTNEERLDPENGIPLVASFDALFDAGLISFDSSGTLIVSSRLNTEERQIFGISQGSLAKKPSAKTAKYLAYHRKHVFLE